MPALKIVNQQQSPTFISKEKSTWQGSKLISYFIIALCKVQIVTFEKLANAFDADAKRDSSLRRIQRFIADYSLDRDLIAKLVFSLLPLRNRTSK